MPQSSSSKFTLPAGYTFSPEGVLMHKVALERETKLVEKAKKRDPDARGLYIYNDFFGYAVLDLVDETLSSAHTFVVKKKWEDAWHTLCALTSFMDMVSDFTQVDDGEHVELVDKVYGALLITTIRGLQFSAEGLSVTRFPDLESRLSDMASWGDCMAGILDDVEYTKVLKAYGVKFFENVTEEERKEKSRLLENAYRRFYNALSPEERKAKVYRKPKSTSPEGKGKEKSKDGNDGDNEDEEEDEDIEGRTWFGQAKASDADTNHPNFKLTPVWKEYKAYLAGASSDPARGPSLWDLSKWSAADKQMFSLDRPRGDEDF